MDHPSASAEIENECSICHMPMARYDAGLDGKRFGIFANLNAGAAATPAAALAGDGVSCTACHQIENKNFGEKASFVGRFVVDPGLNPGERSIYGPYEVDEGRRTVMQSSSGYKPVQSDHIGDSGLCATCHTLYTHTLNSDGEVIGELPEQVPYLEWRHSSYYQSRGCPACHLPTADVDMNISSVLGQSRDRLARHVFRGGNFFIPRVLNKYRDMLNVAALSKELDAVSQGAVDHLETDAARIGIKNVGISRGRLSAEVEIKNLAGHKLPTAYPSRRVWIHFTVCDVSGKVVFESGSISADGSIRGNDNDGNAATYEPHYEAIDDPEKVQIYEVIMEDSEGNVTTGLLKGLRYLKDNRLLPRGFDKARADRDIAVQGKALGDSNFNDTGDRVLYSVELGQLAGPYAVEAELRYQPIGYRWAQNLDSQDAMETKRFVAYYDSMTDATSVVLARATALVE
jgi:hypothetical protein